MNPSLLTFLWMLLSCSATYYEGDPLFLTPYINSGRIQQGRSLAKNKPLLGNALSYSGFFTVNPKTQNNLFFWYFPAEVDHAKAPVIVWLNGGPGCSSVFGALFEIGPYKLHKGWTTKRDYYWSKNMHVLFIDNPAGTGFSFTRGGDYPTDEVEVGKYLLKAVWQFLELFPWLRAQPLYVAGESYGGKYVPALAHAIHTFNQYFDIYINFRGIAIGNGLIDPINQLVHGPHQYQLGLIDEKDMLHLNFLSSKIVENIKAKRWKDATAGFKDLFWNYKGEPANLLYNNTGFTSHFNILSTHDDTSERLTKLMNRSDVKRNLHVGSLPFNNGRISEDFLHNDMMKSVLRWFKEISSNYDVLLYSGQLDIILPYPTTENFLRKMKWRGASGYRNAPRKIWRVGNDVAGYTKTVYHKAGKKKLHFTNILVRSAGHLVPMDQSRWVFKMIKRFTSKRSLDETEKAISCDAGRRMGFMYACATGVGVIRIATPSTEGKAALGASLWDLTFKSKMVPPHETLKTEAVSSRKQRK